MLDLLTIIAQEGGGGGGGGQGIPGCGPQQMILFMMFGAVFYFILIRPQSKEKKRRAEMLGAVKKNDRVVTNGGIIGTVVSVKDDEITLKVDESNNTKITFSRSSIQRITSSETAPTGDSGTK
jgi:preprotein translocase subunit YajC